MRFAAPAADALREAIRDAGGVEVFAIGEVHRGAVSEITVAARGTHDRVLAVLGRPRSGQVVIHNHPSGDLRPSPPDLALAARYAEDGVGFVIVDSPVRADAWIVEPWDPTPATVDPEEVDRLFTEVLPSRVAGTEIREAQRRMARAVTASLNDGKPHVVEAGTGTGKSLAYLVPAALWARANDAKVVVATHTRSLQAQLLTSDLPVLDTLGLEVRYAVLEGRNNYLCKRRLELAVAEQDELAEEARERLDDLVAWSQTTSSGSRTDLGVAVPFEVWERVQSDSDLTLRLRCPHYDSCHFYGARRTAAGAHVVVVNHALLVADLALREEAGFGVLPAYRRLILDEAHHLEEAATGLASARVSSLAVRRAVSPLLDRKKKPGALARLARVVAKDASLPDDVRRRVEDALTAAVPAAKAAPAAADVGLGEVAGVLDPTTRTRRIDAAYEQDPEWSDAIVPQLEGLAQALGMVAGQLDAIATALGDHRFAESDAQPWLDVQRAQRRLSGHATTVAAFAQFRGADADATHVRWIELARSRTPSAVLQEAPIDVAPSLRALLWRALPGTVSTSATLSVGGDFGFWRGRVGLDQADELVLPSPFDHFDQAILGLPTDLPAPNDPAYLRATARATVDAVTASGGGAFVLCTSHRAVAAYATALRRVLDPGTPVLAQGDRTRAALLQAFRDRPDAILVGTDSFWEGVSVKGWGLRLVILPRLPFRVPTDPLWQARHERLKRQGIDPFRALTLPSAVLKLRQGYGRLLRSRRDRGVVLLLDVRVHQRGYGRRVLAALPPARRVKGPWSRVLGEVQRFFTPGGP